MLHLLPIDILKSILNYGSMREWYEQKLYLICKSFSNFFFSNHLNGLWKLQCEEVGLDTIPVGLYCFEFIRWQKNNMKIKTIMKMIFEKRENVFISGGAGVGKSFLLNLIIKKFRQAQDAIEYEVCASTGAAAILIGGITLHAFAGFGIVTIDKLPLKIILNKLSDESKKKWRNIDVLIVDEISMIHPSFFETLDLVGRELRGEENKNQPFGGIQIIAIGDFYQLAPVPEKQNEFEQSFLGKRKREEKTSKSKTESPKKEKKELTYCFETNAWKKTFKKEHCFILDFVFRQKDRKFSTILNGIRTGVITDSSMNFLKKRILTNLVPIPPSIEWGSEEAYEYTKDQLFKDDKIKPTEFTCLNIDVRKINDKHLNKLLNEEGEKPYKMKAQFLYNRKNACVVQDELILQEQVKKGCPLPEEFTLCIGAQVMLTVNLDVKAGLINGSRGVVIGFERRVFVRNEKANIYHDPVVLFNGEDERVIRQSCWSYGYHLVKEKLTSNFTRYINPKRIRWSFDFKKNAFELEKKNKQIKKNDNESKFKKSKGEKEDFEDEIIDENEENVDASFVLTKQSESFCGITMIQYPLKLAWALSIHNSQGASLDKAIINPLKSFAYGQVYVALSRVRSFENIYLYWFPADKIKADEKVKEFYEQLKIKN